MITVAMITKNEEGAVAKVIGDIQSVLKDVEILLVDSSADKTAQIAQSMGARVITQFPPKGYGPAMDLVLKSAKGEVVVTLDCDDTYPVKEIPVLAEYIIRDGYDLVDGSRLKEKPKAMPMVNYLANTGFALLASLLFLKKITDLHSGMRAYRKAMLDSVKYNPNADALPVELLLRPIKDGYKVKNVFIEYHERIGKSTLSPLRSAWWTLKRILGVRFS